MPINLRYGQQAVARGFLTPRRLQQVLAKQRALAEQGKKVSVRMILEKAKLLTAEQLGQVDHDLNIKVVKKKKTEAARAVPARTSGPAAKPSVTASSFSGDSEVPQFDSMRGVDPDATLYSPPPPDMEERIRQEKERAKAAVRRGAPAEPSAAPFGEMEPEMEPEPFGEPEMAPEPFGEEPFASPVAGNYDEAHLEPQMEQGGGWGEEAPDLERIDSSPRMQSLAAETHGFLSADSEEVPMLEEAQPEPESAWGEAPAADLGPAEGEDAGFGSFGEDAPSVAAFDEDSAPSFHGTAPLGGAPDQAEVGPVAEDEPDAWGEEAPAAPAFDTSEIPGGGAIDATVFSPPPPSLPPTIRTRPVPQPVDESWPEPEPSASRFHEEEEEPVDVDATLYSPPPPGTRGRVPAPQFAGPAEEDDEGYFRSDDETGGETAALEAGAVARRALDDAPTAAPPPEDVHPLRRRGAESTRDIPEDIPEEDEAFSAGAARRPAGARQGGFPRSGSGAGGGKRAATGAAVVLDEDEGEGKKKRKKTRLLGWFVALLLLLVLVLVLPVMFPHITPFKELRTRPEAAPIYKHVHEIFNTMSVKVRGVEYNPVDGSNDPWDEKKTPSSLPEEDSPANTPAEGGNQAGGGNEAGEGGN